MGREQIKDMDKVSDTLDPSFAWKSLLEECCHMDREQTLSLVMNGLQQAGSGKALADIIEQMISFIGLSELLPPSYARYRPLLIHGFGFILRNLPVEQLAGKIVDQLHLSLDSSSGDRICLLVNDMPTLQKLGQIICRNPGLDPSIKKALTTLEDKIHSVSYADIQPAIQREIQATGMADCLDVEETILAEASVCTVTPGIFRSRWPVKETPVVLKLVKSSVRQNLPAELEIFDLLADFFDQHKKEWNIGDLRFRDTFSQVRHLIENEVRLPVEQKNLVEARAYYCKDKHIIVPEPLDCSTPHMTIMSRLDGNKITDVEQLTPAMRRRLAASIVDICIRKPIQDMRPVTIFHGDPHAGNIAYRFKGRKPQIIFYDWGMMGHLNQQQRYALGLMAFGILLDSPKTIIFAAQMVTQINVDANTKAMLYDVIVKVLEKSNTELGNLLTTMEEMFEALSQSGITFPTDFLMYEKSLVTLEGVLADIDPNFSRDHYLLWAVLRELYFNIIRLQFQLVVLKKTWSLYRYGFLELLKFQKSVIRYVLKHGLLAFRPRSGWWRSNT